MRTTVDLPPDLMRAAKMRAAERGETLKELFIRAIIREVGQGPGKQRGGRVALPLVGSVTEPTVDVSNADLEAALAAEDAERYGNR